MNRNQTLIVIGSLVFFLILFFGFDTIPLKQKDLEKSRSLTIESTGVTNLVNEAMSKLDPSQKSMIEAIRLDIDKSGTDTLLKIERLKSLSGIWYEFGFPAISGSIADEVSSLVKTEESWAISGTTYALCVKNAQNQKEKDFCSKRAIKAFENAISLAPDKIEHRINLAICFVDNPLQDNPMHGILMLRDLNEKFPENVAVMNQLAKLALQTNQIDKAISRLETAIKIEPENQTTICLLVSAYRQSGNEAKAKEFEYKCVN